MAGRLEGGAGAGAGAGAQLERVRGVLAGKEAGFARLQAVIDSAHVAAANTAPAGRQQVGRRTSHCARDSVHLK